MRGFTVLTPGAATLFAGSLSVPPALAGPVTTTIPEPLHGDCAGLLGTAPAGFGWLSRRRKSALTGRVSVADGE